MACQVPRSLSAGIKQTLFRILLVWRVRLLHVFTDKEIKISQLSSRKPRSSLNYERPGVHGVAVVDQLARSVKFIFKVAILEFFQFSNFQAY